MISGVTAPLGFRAAAVAAGIKPGRLDLALLVADGPCAAAGVFTTNLAKAAPVVVSAEHLAAGRARAVVVNAGCANAGTGEAGLADARETAAAAARALGCAPAEVVVASTGVIGVRLPMEKVCAGVAAAAGRLSREGGSRRRARHHDHRHEAEGGRRRARRSTACRASSAGWRRAPA